MWKRELSITKVYSRIHSVTSLRCHWTPALLYRLGMLPNVVTTVMSMLDLLLGFLDAQDKIAVNIYSKSTERNLIENLSLQMDCMDK